MKRINEIRSKKVASKNTRIINEIVKQEDSENTRLERLLEASHVQRDRGRRLSPNDPRQYGRRRKLCLLYTSPSPRDS